MFGQLFGRYLIEKDLLTKPQYDTIIDKHLSVYSRLGTLAVEEGFLTERQVDQIHQLQRIYDKRFGDIALENHFLSQKELDTLLAKRVDPYEHFLNLLSEYADFSTSEVEKYLGEFQSEKGFSDAEMTALKREDPDALVPVLVFSSKPYVTDIAGLIVRNLTRFVTRDFYIGKAVKCQTFSYSHLACQLLSGDESIAIAIAEEDDSGSFLQVACEFSHVILNEVNDDALDSVCEFINVTSGILASSLSKQNISVDLEPPSAYENQTAKGEFYAVPIYLEDRTLHLLIAVNSSFLPGKKPAKIGVVNKKPTKVKDGEGRTTVLLVDDSKMSRSMLREILENANYNVVMEASNGLDGLAAYKECNPDIVTLDITMPKMDGLELLRKILDYDPDARAIMITAAGQQDKLIEALKCGAKRFISKPFDADEILINMSDVLEY